jgi:hypothetical protein
MTTLNEAKEALLDLFNTGWASRTVFSFDNESFTPPTNDYWARVSVRHQAARQETLGRVGNRKFLRQGAVFVQLFAPLDAGTETIDGHVEAAIEIFEGVSISGTTIRIYDAIARELGRDENWFMVVVEANFEYDETK